MGEPEIKERLTRIETLLEVIKEKMESDNDSRQKCYNRFKDVENYIEVQKIQKDSLITKTGLSFFFEIIKTLTVVITTLIAMRILHFG